MPLFGNLKRRNPRSSVDISDQIKKLKLLNEASVEKVPRETKRNEPETENSGCAVHPKDEDENYEPPCKSTPDLEEQITQPTSHDCRVPDDEEKKSKMTFGKSLMKGFQTGIKRKQPVIAKSKSHDCICREDEDEENLEPPSGTSTLMTEDFTRTERNEHITRSKSLTSVLSEKKDDESKTFKMPSIGKLKLMKGLQMVIKRKKPAKSRSQPCVCPQKEDENEEKNLKMLSKLEKKKNIFRKSQSYDSVLTECNNEEQKSKMPFRKLVERVKRKKPVLGKSKSCDDFKAEDKNQRQKYERKEEGSRVKESFRLQLREIFRRGKKRNESIKTKSNGYVLPENEDEEQEPMVTFSGLPPIQPSTTSAQIHHEKSKDHASVLPGNDDEEKASMVAFPGLPSIQTSTTRAQIHQAKSKDHTSVLPGNAGDEEKESMVSFYKFSEEPIGYGAAGTCVYSGVSTKDGRNVAIKKINCHTKKQSSQYKKEIEYLLRLQPCQNVVNYLDVEVRKDVVFIMLELMEGTLETLVNQPNLEVNFVELSHDMITALQFLHKIKIIHRDIKPRNILVTSFPRIMLKLADFGLSKMIGSESSTYNGGTRCWMAPEVINLDQFSTASDAFASGLVLHYLMTSKHPFAPADVTCNRENCLRVEHDIVHNILYQNLNVDSSLSPEAFYLIDQMLKDDKEQRPNAEEALVHPFFWPDQKKIKFLEATANQPETHQIGASDFKKDLKLTQLGAQFQTIPWSEQSPTMAYVYNEMMMAGRRKYNTTSVAELLRFMRNAHQHVSERTPLFQKFVLQDFVFFNEFKSLFITVYETVRKHEWHKNKNEIKFAIL